MISQDGIIDVAEFCRSPNFDERPHNAGIDLIVIHAISLPPGHYKTQLIKDLFLNCLDPGQNEFLKSIKDTSEFEPEKSIASLPILTKSLPVI